MATKKRSARKPQRATTGGRYEWVASEYQFSLRDGDKQAKGYSDDLGEAIRAATSKKFATSITIYTRPPLRHGVAAFLSRADRRRKWTIRLQDDEGDERETKRWAANVEAFRRAHK